MRHRRRRARAARLLAMPIALLAGVAAFGSGQAQASPRVGSGGWQSYLEQPATGNVRAVSATVLSGSVARGIRRDQHAVTAGLALPHSSGALEGKNCKIKYLKRLMYGRANFDLLRKIALLS